MAASDNEEFRNGLREIAQHSIKLVSAFDRVRCCEWVRKLSSMPNNTVESAKIRNEYLQCLRIMVRSHFLHGIFLQQPPHKGLAPLPECLGNDIANRIPELPRCGPIAPYVMHKSPDGRAYIAAKRIPGGGVFCYMAVTPVKEHPTVEDED